MVHRIAFSAVVTGVLWLLPTAASSTTSGCQPGSEGATVVLLARSFSAQDTLGTVIVAKRMFVVAQIPCSQRATGAIGDPSFFKGRRAAHDIFPGVQLTRRDFSGVVKVSMTSSVRAGGLVALVVTVTPRARCTSLSKAFATGC